MLTNQELYDIINSIQKRYKSFCWMVEVLEEGGRGPVDSAVVFSIQYVSGMADGYSCEEETFTHSRR